MKTSPKAIGARIALALLVTVLVCCLLPGAALAIGSASVDGPSPVTGTTGTAINVKPFTLTIAGNSLNTIPTSAEFTSWMKNMPAGLGVTVAGSYSTKVSISITIDGTPTQSSDAPFSIVIPKEKLHDPSASDMPVTVDTYSNAWWNISPSADSVIAVSLDGGTSYTTYTDFAAGWNSAIGSGNKPNTKVQLLKDWTAGTDGFGTGAGFQHGGIVVPDGKTVSLDLFGKTIAANAKVTDSAVFVIGALTLSDSGSGGKLTGATQGCVYIFSTGGLTMSGGSITSNATAAINGNVFVDGSFSVSGSASVTGNTKNGSPCNVYLPNGKTVTVPTYGGLSASARIGVTTQTPPTRYAPIAVTNAGIPNCSASFSSDAGNIVQYDATAHRVLIAAPIDIDIKPSSQFPVGNAGGNLTVSVGHGISAAELGTAHISAVRLDGALLTAGPGADYTMTDGGSVIITLYQSYLNTLPVGAHTLSVAIGSGAYGGVTVATGITVLPAATAGSVPQAGDDAQPWLWLGLALAAGAVLTAQFVFGRKGRKAGSPVG